MFFGLARSQFIQKFLHLWTLLGTFILKRELVGVLGWMIAPEGIFTLISGTYECYLTWQKCFADMTNDLLQYNWILKLGGYPGLSQWNLNIITNVLTRGRDRDSLLQKKCMWHLKQREAVSGRQKMLCHWLWRGKKELPAQGKRFSPGASRRNQPCWHLDYAPIRLISNLWPQN